MKAGRRARIGRIQRLSAGRFTSFRTQLLAWLCRAAPNMQEENGLGRVLSGLTLHAEASIIVGGDAQKVLDIDVPKGQVSWA